MGHALLLQRPRIGVGDDPTTEDQQVTEVAIAEFLHDAREQREVSAAEQRQANSVDVFLQRSLGDLLRSLMQTRVDDLKTMVSQCARDRLRAAIMPIKTWLCHDNSIGPIHK